MESVYILKDILSKEQVYKVIKDLNDSAFVDGKSTASGMAKNVKNNEQVDISKVPGLLDLIVNSVTRNEAFKHLTMAKNVSNILVSRYKDGMEYGRHTDNAIMGSGFRSDISFTLFLTEPDSYEGGDLTLETVFGDKKIKLEAGSLIFYPTGELHRVAPVTKGERIVIVGWVESRIRDSRKRQLVLDLVQVRKQYLKKNGHDMHADLLLKSTENLKRMWDE
jgi:PKHD-type hydroxylase